MPPRSPRQALLDMLPSHEQVNVWFDTEENHGSLTVAESEALHSFALPSIELLWAFVQDPDLTPADTVLVDRFLNLRAMVNHPQQQLHPDGSFYDEEELNRVFDALVAHPNVDTDILVLDLSSSRLRRAVAANSNPQTIFLIAGSHPEAIARILYGAIHQMTDWVHETPIDPAPEVILQSLRELMSTQTHLDDPHGLVRGAIEATENCIEVYEGGQDANELRDERVNLITAVIDHLPASLPGGDSFSMSLSDAAIGVRFLLTFGRMLAKIADKPFPPVEEAFPSAVLLLGHDA